jgi:CRISPR-associated protein Cas5t
MPPTAAWGLVLNLAGIESRGELKGAVTQRSADAPVLDIAVGILALPERAVLYQQLHAYPVGASSKDLEAGTHGAKYHIAPARREILIDYDGMIGARTDDADLARRIVDGLAGRLPEARYGLPFAGDNNFLFNAIEVVDEPPATRWFTPVVGQERPQEATCRLTTVIDRADSSRTVNRLFGPTEPISLPPESAWQLVPENEPRGQAAQGRERRE